LRRQRPQRWQIDAAIQFPARARQFAEGALVQFFPQFADALVELGQAEELAFAQGRQYPTLYDLHAGFDLSLVAGMIRPRREDTNAIVDRQVVVGRVQFRLVIAGLFHARLPVVRNHQASAALKELKGVHMGADPVPQATRPGRFCVGIAAGAQHRHKHIGIAGVSGQAVDDRHRLAGVIDEHLLAGAMVLSQNQIQPPCPSAI